MYIKENWCKALLLASTSVSPQHLGPIKLHARGWQFKVLGFFSVGFWIGTTLDNWVNFFYFKVNGQRWLKNWQSEKTKESTTQFSTHAAAVKVSRIESKEV